jgi:hypothetical protein
MCAYFLANIGPIGIAWRFGEFVLFYNDVGKERDGFIQQGLTLVIMQLCMLAVSAGNSYE